MDEKSDRIGFARSLMANAPAAPQFQSILDSEAAMAIICQKYSSIRNTGNKIAHTYAEQAGDLTALRATTEQILDDPAEREGMSDIISCLSRIRFPVETTT